MATRYMSHTNPSLIKRKVAQLVGLMKSSKIREGLGFYKYTARAGKRVEFRGAGLIFAIRWPRLGSEGQIFTYARPVVGGKSKLLTV